MDKDDSKLSTRRCKFDSDNSRTAQLDAENMDSLLNSSRWDVTSVKIRASDRERVRSRDGDADGKAMIACLKREIAEYKEQNLKLFELVREQKKKLLKYEDDHQGIDLIKERTNVTVTALQKEQRAAQERVVELESRNRVLVEEREKLEIRVAKAEKQLFDFSTEILRSIGLDDIVKTGEDDKVISTLREWFREHTVLQGKHTSVTGEMKKLEDVVKEQKGTIERLLKEISNKDVYREKHDSLLVEFDKHKLSKVELEKEIEHLKAKLATADSEIGSLAKKLEETSATVSKLDVDRRQEANNARNHDAQYNSLKQSLAAMLSDPFSTCAARDDDIKDRIRQLQLLQTEKSQSYSSVEDRIKELTKKFEQQYDLHREAEKKLQIAEKEIGKLQEKLATSERELGAGDVFRDSLREERQKCQKAIAKIAKAIKIEKERLELDGVEVVTDLVIRRIERLLGRRDRARETDEFEEAPSRVEFDLEPESVASLKRRLAKAKEQLEAKETHLDLLRKKLGQLEERSASRVVEEDETIVKRLEKRLRKMQQLLDEAKHDNSGLKAELLECQNLRLQVLEQDKDIQALERTLEKLEKVRQKQAVKIVRLKTSIGEAERDIESEERAPMADKVRALKAALDDSKRHERLLREFRIIVGRMVGLNMSSSIVSDAEIFSRLEQQLRPASVSDDLPHLNELYRLENDSQFSDNSRHRSRSPSPPPQGRLRSGSLSRGRGHRSKSPIKVDTRQY